MSTKGAIYASCGHKLEDDDEGLSTITLGDNCDCDGVYRCSYHAHVCRKCYEEMKARGDLATPEEADKWIRDGVWPERMRLGNV